MSLLTQVFWMRKIEISILFAFIFFVAIFSFLLPITFSILIERVLPAHAEKHFSLLISGAFILVILRLLLNAAQDYLFLFLRSSIERTVSLSFLEKSITTFSNQVLERVGQTNTSNRLLIWLTNFQYFLSEFIYFCGYAIVVSIMVFVILYMVAPTFAFIGLAFLFLHWVNYSFHYPMSKYFSTQYNAQKGETAQLLSATFQAKKMINVFQIEEPMATDLDEHLEQMHTGLYGREQVANTQELLQNMMRALQFIIFVYVGVKGVLYGSVSIGELLLCILLIGLAYQPIYRLSKVTKALSESETQLKRLEEVISSDVTSSEDICAVQMSTINAIQLQNIEYSNEQQKIFNQLSYQFDKGNIYLIEGESGQGKTTLLKLIAGLIPCDKGQVLWGANQVGGVAIQSKQRLLSWMTQSSDFIEGSLQDNITLFSPSIDTNKLELAFENSACGFLKQQNRAELLLEGSAQCLSGGQAQRLNLARAIYHGGIIRLFDEPSANLDENTERQVLQSMCQQKQNHISIIVSHRKSIRQYADKVLCLRDGKLVDALASNHL